ncbi:MAG: isoleucine--tRNA ligase [Anaerolineales bacterium]|nr:isoleucine--tRNA ligase [Anaerolineales bacterium]
MPFKDVPSNVDFPTQERETLAWWKENKSLDKLRAIQKGRPKWSFMDGPITANNPMGVHHAWGRTYKDLYNRYQAMRGHELRYQQGFDCQGLWVEVEVEKEMGFKSKKDIEAYGMAAFVNKCKERVLRFSAVQTEQSIRLGYWMDWNDTDQLRWLGRKIIENPTEVITVEGPEGPVTDTVENIVGRLGMPELGGSYYTLSNENNYMIWRAIKICYENNWLYRGADVMPWCPRCATGISQHEIVTDGYAEITHRSVTVKFPLRDRPGEALLVWTTTPWTLTSNVAAAVGPDLDYVKVKMMLTDDIFYLSKGATKMLRGKYEVLQELKGKDMLGWTYDGPFDDLTAEQQPGGWTHLKELIEGLKVSAKDAHQVITWDEVGEEEGTGIVHIAPGAGAEDFALGKENGLPIVAPLDDEGYFVEGFDYLTGLHVSEVADPIFKNLEEKGLLYHVERYTHRYPTCWRCKTELVFRLVDEWFISMDELRPLLMDITRQIRWIPSFGLERELDWLRNMHDWMISKKRYWGLALPIWQCDSCDAWTVVGDDFELKTRAAVGYEEFAGHTPHRPWIDTVKLKCDQCGGLMSRIPDVGNPWLDAGIVSFSTLRYRQDPDYWRKWYPADWISESFPGQFRNWFYSMLVMGAIIDKSPSFLSNFGYATLWAEDGRPMHKSWGNAIEFNEAADKMGVDVMRWMYCNHKPEQNLLFGYHRADEVRRQFLIPLWNVYNFFVTYAKLDGWEPTADGRPETAVGNHRSAVNGQRSLLDSWIIARLNEVVALVTASLENYDAYTATNAIQDLIEDLTNWYVRRSRRRFWKSEHDTDKDAAYATLYHVLTTLTRLLAPFTPFVTEVMYQNLVRSVDSNAPESIHHCPWPEANEAAIDRPLLEQMDLARRIASLGLGARGSANIKVRQPLARALAHVGQAVSLSPELKAIIVDELNVKKLEFVAEAGELVTYKVLPNLKLLGPKLGKNLPAVRQAIEAADPAELAAKIQASEAVTFTVDGQPLELTAEELLIQTQPAEGLAVAADKVITVGVDVVITDELASEGLARELVRRIQNMRKDAGFDIADKIAIYYQAEGAVHRVFRQWADYIKAETLAVEIDHQLIPESAFQRKEKVDGLDVMLGVKRVASQGEASH